MDEPASALDPIATQQIFEDPKDSRTEAYVTGRIG
jgi:ABC-type phosphate transport system ATPase subunit